MRDSVLNPASVRGRQEIPGRLTPTFHDFHCRTEPLSVGHLEEEINAAVGLAPPRLRRYV